MDNLSRRLQPRPLHSAQADLILASGRALTSPPDLGSISHSNFAPLAAGSDLVIARWIKTTLQTALLRQTMQPEQPTKTGVYGRALEPRNRSPGSFEPFPK